MIYFSSTQFFVVTVGLISKYSWTRMMLAASGFCWVDKVCSSSLPPSLPRFLPSFLFPWACSHQKWQFVYPTLYLFSFLLALVFSRDKGEGRRGRTSLIPGRSRSLGPPSPPAPNQPQDNQRIFLFPLFFFCCFVKIFLSVLYLPADIFPPSVFGQIPGGLQ